MKKTTTTKITTKHLASWKQEPELDNNDPNLVKELEISQN